MRPNVTPPPFEVPNASLTAPIQSRRERLCWWGVFMLFLALRLGVAWEIGTGTFHNSIFAPSVQSDLNTYMELGRNIASGKWPEVFYYQPYYYAVFLPLCYLISHNSIVFVVFVQALLSTFAAHFAGRTANLLGGRMAGWTAFALTGLAAPLVFYVPFHQIATLQSFHLALLAYCTVQALRQQRWRWFVLAGAVAGAGMLTRGNLLLVAVPLGMLFLWDGIRQKAWRKGLAMAGIFAATAILLEVPFIVYNSVQTGHFSGPSTAADAVLTLGNTPEAPPGGRNPGLPAGPMEYPECYSVWMEGANDISVPARIWTWVKHEPGAFLELTFRKLLLFWDAREIPNNVAFAGEGRSSLLLRFATLPAGVVLLLGVAGMLLYLPESWKKRRMELWGLYGIVFFYWGGTAAFYILSRFRAPVLPVTAVFGGLAVALAWQKLQSRDWNFWKRGGALAFLFAGFLVYASYYVYQNFYEIQIMRLVRPNGVSFDDLQNRTVRFDHGPMTFGGWNALRTPPGTVIVKRFAGDFSDSSKPMEVTFSVQSEQSGALALTINGLPVTITFPNGGDFRTETVTLNRTSHEVTLHIVRNTANASLLIDTQRNYGRTSYNHSPAPGEAILRIRTL